MDDLFTLKLALSFLIGGTWTILTTILADRYGSKIGGLIAGLPSTALFSLFFLAWTQTTVFAIRSTTIIPATVGAENLFVLSYIYLIYIKKASIWSALFISFCVWFAVALPLVFLKFDSYILSLTGYIFSLTTSYFVIEHLWKIKSVTGNKIKYTPEIILTRGLLSGTVVAFAVLMGKLGGPTLGGAFAGFPALFTGTILITYFSHGPLFSVATMKSSVLSAISIVIYSVAVRYCYVPLGIIWGTLAAMTISCSAGYFIYKLVIEKSN